MIYEYRAIGIDCPMCAIHLKTLLGNYFNEKEVSVNLITHDVKIDTWQNEQEVLQALNNCSDFLHGSVFFRKIER